MRPWVQKFYPVPGLGSGGRLLCHFQTPVLYWINFSLRVEAARVASARALIAKAQLPHSWAFGSCGRRMYGGGKADKPTDDGTQLGCVLTHQPNTVHKNEYILNSQKKKLLCNLRNELHDHYIFLFPEIVLCKGGLC